jgi:hypothetical protein
MCGDESDKVSGIPMFPRKLASRLCYLDNVRAEPLSIIRGLVRMDEPKWAQKVSDNKWVLERNLDLLQTSKFPIEDIEWIDGDYSIDGFGEVLIKSGMENLYERFMEVVK